MDITDEQRAAVLTELIADTSIIQDASRDTVKMWLMAKRAALQADPAHEHEFMEFFRAQLETVILEMKYNSGA